MSSRQIRSRRMRTARCSPCPSTIGTMRSRLTRLAILITEGEFLLSLHVAHIGLQLIHPQQFTSGVKMVLDGFHAGRISGADFGSALIGYNDQQVVILGIELIQQIWTM